MKLIFGLVLMTMLIAPQSSAQTRGGEEQQLVKLENEWSAAVVKGDGPSLQGFYADEYLATDSDGMVRNKAQDIANFTSGASKLASYKLDDLKVHIYGDVAVVTGSNTVTGSVGVTSEDVTGNYRFTDVFVRRGGRWQCVASQASRITTSAKAAS
jgi:ketosteroid isomerase-like protein